MLPVVLNPLLPETNGHSSLRELVYRPSVELRAVVAGHSGGIDGRQFDVRFDGRNVRGILVLDEGDLITIWEPSHYVPTSFVYEITQGSIFETLAKRHGVLSVSMPQESLENMHEYLLATDDDCVLVLSGRAPIVKEIASKVS